VLPAFRVAFIEALHPQRCLAWVQKYDGIDIDRTKRVASFDREGRLRWIGVSWTRSLFCILRDDVNLILCDIWELTLILLSLFHFVFNLVISARARIPPLYKWFLIVLRRGSCSCYSASCYLEAMVTILFNCEKLFLSSCRQSRSIGQLAKLFGWAGAFVDSGEREILRD